MLESGRSSLQPFWEKRQTSRSENQILSRPKSLNIRVFVRESAKSG
jgi:hypothetical protein